MMMKIECVSEEQAEAFSNRISSLLDIISPAFTAERDVSVKLNLVAMLVALVLRGVNPTQHDEIMQALKDITAKHLESLNATIELRAKEMLFDIVHSAFSERIPGNEQPH
jgi:hypothetical protein